MFPIAARRLIPVMTFVVATIPVGMAAQTPPATYYGSSGAGDAIEARFNGVQCATATAGGDGFWRLTVSSGACGITEGGSLAFYRNGSDSGARETFRPGGVPSNVASGVATGGAGAIPAPAPMPGTPSDGVFSGALPPSRGAGLLVTGTVVTPSSLRSSLDAKGCRVQAFAVLRSGSWLVYIEGAPGAVNANFPASLPATSPFFVRC